MSARESLLPEALSRLTLFDVAKACGIEIKVGVQRSPFREDRKESFSVQKNRTGWKDFATGEAGSIWAFTKLCMPAAAEGEMARFLIGLAGLDQETPAGAPRPPMARRLPPRRIERKFKHADRWSQLVANRWAQGVGGIDVYAVQRLAQRRGWPDSFVHGLIAIDKISYPLLPWTDACEDHARRAWAFKVERLDLSSDGGLDADPVGYHQTFEIWDKGEAKARKSFVYVPYEPAAEKQRSNFQRFLRGTVPPYPFIIGGRKPKLLVLFEGQWDAATFFFSALADGSEQDAESVASLPWAVVGLRGAQSIEATLEVLTPYLQSANPDVWLWPDNDNAGSVWLRNEDGKPPCLRDRLRALTWGNLHVTKVTPVEYGEDKWTKDLNDIFKHVAPVTQEDIRSIAESVKLAHHFAPAGVSA